jgi:hypothetical protein
LLQGFRKRQWPELAGSCRMPPRPALKICPKQPSISFHSPGAATA